jgi:hypothetical protein
MIEDAQKAVASAAFVPTPDSLSFMDTLHVVWCVREREAGNDPGSCGHHCLIFECADVVRRVWEYPAFWRQLGPEALIVLSWRR